MRQFLMVVVFLSCNTGQKPDSTFDSSVLDPAYHSIHPRVLHDEGHRNFHKANGTFSPFVQVLTNDGYLVDVNRDAFRADVLKTCDVLIVVTPKGAPEKDDPAFTEEECTVVEKWVRAGGSLLLVAEHHPIGGAVQILAAQFGVSVTNGYVMDPLHFRGSEKYMDELVFSRENKFLGDHPILNGRRQDEKVNTVVSFTGPSLLGPDSSSVLLRLSDAAMETVKDSSWSKDGKHYSRFQDSIPAKGRNQGLAMPYGQGRVIVLGEAGMLSAQMDDRGNKFGMNLPGLDNKQFVLNMIHWLSRLF